MEITRQVIESNPNPIYVKDESGKIVLANSAYANLQGLTVDELLLTGTSELDYSYERDLEILANGETTHVEEFYKLSDGKKVWFKTSKKLLPQHNGRNYLVSISSDITEWKERLQAAAESVKAKDNFLSNMTNEIVTPINAILGMARLIKKSSLNKAQEEYLNIILSIADNLLSMPNNILEYAKINSGELTVESIPFNINSTLQNVILALNGSAKEQGLDLYFEEPLQKLPIVEGDPFRLNQILTNLIKNAIKFTKKGEITVSAEVYGKSGNTLTVQFCVRDTGIGMTEEKFESLLQSFNQPKTSNSPLFAGTGLGLTICKSMIEAQGGKIWMDSKLGQGSSFYFTLPFSISEKESSEEPDKAIEEKQKTLDLLLVEDNEVNQLLTVSQLEEYNINVDLAFNGEDAVAKTKEKSYDLILMDIQMPTLDGIEATSIIRTEANLNNSTPIVAFTANAHTIDLGKYKSAGFTDYLLKPYNKSNLYLIISKYTGRPLKLKTSNKHTFYRKEAALYDFSALGDLANDAVFIRKMQQLFIDTVPGQLDELAEYIQQKDWDAVANLAHRLKSTFGNIKITEAAEALKKIESAARSRRNLDQQEFLFDKVSQTTDKVLAIFTNMLHVAS